MNGTPDWFTNGRTALIMKDNDDNDKKENDVTNFWLITCLPFR